MLVEETTTSLTLADTAGKLHAVLRKDLDEFISTGRSHMPEKLEAKMDFQQMADVFAFIAGAGPPPVDVAGSNPRVIAAGNTHTCAIYDLGVWCWGDDLYGQATVPSGLSNPSVIAVGTVHSCAIDDGVCSSGPRARLYVCLLGIRRLQPRVAAMA